MEPAKVPKSFGCFSQKGLMLRLNSFRSKSHSSATSNSTSPTLSSSPRSPKRKTQYSTRENEYREVFARFDGDKDGKISATELRSYFGSVGEYMSYEEAREAIGGVDGDGDGLIDFGEFMGMMTVEAAEETVDVKAAFEVFELEKGCGRISAESLQKTLSRLGESRTYEECLEMIKVFDTHGKGGVDFTEFRRMMTAA